MRPEHLAWHHPRPYSMIGTAIDTTTVIATTTGKDTNFSALSYHAIGTRQSILERPCHSFTSVTVKPKGSVLHQHPITWTVNNNNNNNNNRNNNNSSSSSSSNNSSIMAAKATLMEIFTPRCSPPCSKTEAMPAHPRTCRDSECQWPQITFDMIRD